MPEPAGFTDLSRLRNAVKAKAEDYIQTVNSLPQPLLVLLPATFALGSLSAVVGSAVYRRYFRRLRSGEWILPDIFQKRKWVKGRVTYVGDADNFRFYHTPGFGWRWPLKFRWVPTTYKGLKDQTIHIRIAGVDAPEGAHFGRPAQPYAAGSLTWLKDRLLGRTVYCQLLRRDQYSRVVAVVVSPRLLPGRLAIHRGTSISLEMLKAGWGTVYEQAGAEYGRWGKEAFLKAEAEAKAARRGMWAAGTSGETPAEYKRRYANAAKEDGAPAQVTQTAESTPKPAGWLGLLWR